MGSRSSSQDVQMIGHHRAPDAEDQDDQGQAQRYLGHGDRNRENGEDHPGRVAAEAGEGDQVDVDGIEHELDAQQDADGIAPGDHAEETGREQDGRQGEVGLQSHRLSPPCQIASQTRPEGAADRRRTRLYVEDPRRPRTKYGEVSWHGGYSSGRAKEVAPRRAATKRTASSAKGSTERVRRSWPMARVRSPVTAGRAVGSGTLRTKSSTATS